MEHSPLLCKRPRQTNEAGNNNDDLLHFFFYFLFFNYSQFHNRILRLQHSGKQQGQATHHTFPDTG